MKKIAKFFLGKTYGQSLFRFLFLLGLKGMNFGGGSDLKESGEKWVLEYFAKQSSNAQNLTLFDVGANKGDYALEAQKIIGTEVKIYCFEPSKKTFELLNKNISGKHIKTFNLGLSNESGKISFFSDSEGSGLASLYKRDAASTGAEMKLTEEVEVDTLDNFCVKENISAIDFLKLDVEGNEYKALLGAKKMLEDGNIKFIQFEFGGTDVDSKVFFRDFFKLLSPKYNISRILKNGLKPITEYKETEEIFITTNYLAILK